MATIIDFVEIIPVADKLKKQGQKIVLIHGCFDQLHKGHLELFRSAEKRGVVFVGVDNDRSVKNLKGKTRPLFSLIKRIEAINKQKSVDFVFILGPKKDYSTYFKKLYKNISPDYLITADGEDLHKRMNDIKGLGIKLVVMEKKVFLNKL